MTPLPQASPLVPLPPLPYGTEFVYAPTATLTTLAQQTLQGEVEQSFGVRLPDDWDWSWEVGQGQGPYTGRFSVRVKSWLWKAHKIKATKPVVEKLAKLGTVVQRFAPTDAPIYLDLTQDLTWADGTFGDSYSCFIRGDRIGAKVLVKGGGGAIRRFELHAQERVPYGRAWVLPCAFGWLVTNPRDKRQSKTSVMEVFCAALCQLVGLTGGYAAIQGDLRHNPDVRRWDGTFYNDGGGSTWLCAPTPAVLEAGCKAEVIYHYLPQRVSDPAHRWEPLNWDDPDYEQEEQEAA